VGLVAGWCVGMTAYVTRATAKVLMTNAYSVFSLAAMSKAPWTDEENDLIVADYFAMLADIIAQKLMLMSPRNRR